MTLPAQKFREIVFLLVYSHDFGSDDENELIAMIMKELAVTKKAVRDAMERTQLILEYRDQIDKLISNTSKEYKLTRIPGIERNILRLSAYELLYDEEIPEKVAIAEAIRLARKFSTPESGTFINAILDQLYKENHVDTDAGPKQIVE